LFVKILSPHYDEKIILIHLFLIIKVSIVDDLFNKLSYLWSSHYFQVVGMQNCKFKFECKIKNPEEQPTTKTKKKLSFKSFIKTHSFSILLASALLNLAFIPSSLHAQEALNLNNEPNFYENNKRFDQENLLILQVNIGNNLILDEPIVGFKTEDTNFFFFSKKQEVFLLMRDLMDTLEFPIEISDDSMSASGWFSNKDNKFEMNLRGSEVLIGGERSGVSQNDAVLFEDEIYINIKTLQEWFGLELDFSIKNQEIVINSGGLLPIERRFERQKEWSKLKQEQELSSKRKDEKIKSEFIEGKYKLASIPFGDVTYSQGFNSSKDGTKDSSSQFSALLAGDLLYLSNQLFINAQDNEITSMRLTSGRKSQEGKLLGALGATEFSLGDIFTPEISLAARSQLGRGASISNYPLEYVNQFNQVEIRGNAQPNWDVELYRNDSLLSFTKVGSDGIYEFTNEAGETAQIPLVAGLNLIRLVFHGPFGQKYEETKKYMVGSGLLKKNKLYYRFAANEHNKNLINIGDESGSSDNAIDGTKRFFGELGYGISESTSAVASFIRTPDEDANDANSTSSTGETKDYLGLSLRSSFFGISARLDNIQDLENKTNAQEILLQTLLFKDYNLSTEFRHFDRDFSSESHQSSSDNPLILSSNIRLDGPLKLPFMDFPSRMALIGVLEDYDSGDKRTDLEGEISFGVTRKLGLTTNLKFIDDERDSEGRQTNGRTLMSYLINSQLTIRNTLLYNIEPESEFTSTNIATSYNFGNNFNLSMSAIHQFKTEDNDTTLTSYSSSLSKTFDKFLLSLSANYDSESNYGANISLSTSFGYDIKNKTGIISGTPIANSGAVAAKVFLDDNNNKQFDKGEEVLEDVEIFVGGRKAKTNKDGVALVTNIQTEGTPEVKMNTDTLPDPYLIARRKAVGITTHAGTIQNIDFPVSRVGEVSGYVALNKDGGDLKLFDDSNEINPASNVKIEVIDKSNNEVFVEITSGYDGFYLAEMVPFGKYLVRVSPAQANRLNFSHTKEYDLTINMENELNSNTNFVIQKGGRNKKIKEKKKTPAKKTVSKFKVGSFKKIKPQDDSLSESPAESFDLKNLKKDDGEKRYRLRKFIKNPDDKKQDKVIRYKFRLNN
jgi:hypothetical protein